MRPKEEPRLKRIGLFCVFIGLGWVGKGLEGFGMDIEKGVTEGLGELSVEGFGGEVGATVERFNGCLPLL